MDGIQGTVLGDALTYCIVELEDTEFVAANKLIGVIQRRLLFGAVPQTRVSADEELKGNGTHITSPVAGSTIVRVTVATDSSALTRNAPILDRIACDQLPIHLSSRSWLRAAASRRSCRYLYPKSEK